MLEWFHNAVSSEIERFALPIDTILCHPSIMCILIIILWHESHLWMGEKLGSRGMTCHCPWHGILLHQDKGWQRWKWCGMVMWYMDLKRCCGSRVVLSLNCCLHHMEEYDRPWCSQACWLFVGRIRHFFHPLLLFIVISYIIYRLFVVIPTPRHWFYLVQYQTIKSNGGRVLQINEMINGNQCDSSGDVIMVDVAARRGMLCGVMWIVSYFSSVGDKFVGMIGLI